MFRILTLSFCTENSVEGVFECLGWKLNWFRETGQLPKGGDL